MAVATAPLMSSEARGKLGGLVYNTWRGIATIKAKTAPAQPRSQRQLYLRANATQITRAWQALDQAVRDAWDAYAVTHPEINWTGNSKRLTGANWYQRCNTRLRVFLGTTISDPPAVPAPDAVTNWAGAGAAGEIVMTWTDTALVNGKVLIYVSGPHSAGQQPAYPKARWIAIAAMAAATYTIEDLQPGTYDVWGASFDPATGLISVLQLTTETVT